VRLSNCPLDRQSRMSSKRKSFTIMTGRHAADPGELAENLAAQPIDGMPDRKGATRDGIKRAFGTKSFEIACFYSCGALENLWRRSALAWIRSAEGHCHALMQACATKTFQIALSIGVSLERHVFRDPGQGNIGLRPAKVV
jgi:hypothetical protein